MKVKVISLPYIFQVLYVLCFTRPRYQVRVYRTIGPLVSFETDSPDPDSPRKNEKAKKFWSFVKSLKNDAFEINTFRENGILETDTLDKAKLKKMFVWHFLPRVSLCGSVGGSAFLFLNIYYLHMDGNGKKKNLRFGKKNLSSSKTGESVGNAKQTIFFNFGLRQIFVIDSSSQLSHTNQMMKSPPKEQAPSLQ